MVKHHSKLEDNSKKSIKKMKEMHLPKENSQGKIIRKPNEALIVGMDEAEKATESIYPTRRRK